MNTVAETTRQRARQTVVATEGTEARTRSLRSSARRLVAWCSADPIGARFSAAREHDERLLQRVGRSR
jgi:hypothetical protein